MIFCNISGYQFSPQYDLPLLKEHFKQYCIEHLIKGTILLSSEGINIMLAGESSEIDSFKSMISADDRFNKIVFKYSYSSTQPFKRLLIKIKKEVITMGLTETIRPEKSRAPHVTTAELKAWLDEGRDFTLLDVRNGYEVEYGTFENAIALGLRHFREFPEAVKQLPETLKEKPMVMFCTGGIRCEKAGLLLEHYGFNKVYQLDGGILKYFSDYQGAYFKGSCFVFDERIALDKQLQPLSTN
jgi:UPF0176 protein